MRKLYALLAGLFLGLAGIHANPGTVTPDVANFTFTIDVPNNNVLFVNTSVLGNEPGPRRAYWSFGDGTIQQTPPLAGTQHHYNNSGTYNVCLRIYRYFTNTGDSVLTAQVCKTVVIEAVCHADWERLFNSSANPLHAIFNALPSHSENKRPEKICWTFGDGRDTCINYSNTSQVPPYVVNHTYGSPGHYEVCVKIFYQGGCEARKCDTTRIGAPDSCRADFERIQVNASTNPLQVTYKALPWHNNQKKPSHVCWQFGDGRDTCIYYLNVYNGQYNITHTYDHPGLYEVCVKITYYGGCEARKCKNLQIGRPDTCAANFERIPSPTSNPLLTYFRALPQHNNNRKPSKICWTFGDNKDTCINYSENYTGQYVVSHHYEHSGQYEVCVKIFYYGGCEARKCRLIEVVQPDLCRADFEKLQVNPSANPLFVTFRALPQHNNNRKPARICWQFGDGSDTCINYPATYTGAYLVNHHYTHRGLYEVCVRILYYGGCEAHKCNMVQIGEPDHCTADFERIQSSAATPLQAYFRALTWNDNNRKPSKICWTFGDGEDTCINYPENYTGQYVVGHRYDHPGQYEVCVKIFYYGGCEARKCKLIIIPPVPGNCEVHLFELTQSNNSLTRTFAAIPSSNPPRRPVRICWYFGDGEDTCIMIDPQVPNPLPYFFIQHTYPGPGIYHACVKIRFDGGCIAEDCREVGIRVNTNICGGYMIDSLIAPRTFRFKGFSIHAPADEAVSFRWTFGDGTTVLGRDVVHTYNVAGNYEVCLMIRTRLGCETKICKTIHVPGNNNEPVLHLSPNPVINVLHIDFLSTHTEQVSVKVLNATGLVVRNYVRNVTVGPNSWNIDLSTLMPGVYSLVVQSPNQLASAIFIKQ